MTHAIIQWPWDTPAFDAVRKELDERDVIIATLKKQIAELQGKRDVIIATLEKEITELQGKQEEIWQELDKYKGVQLTAKHTRGK